MNKRNLYITTLVAAALVSCSPKMMLTTTDEIKAIPEKVAEIDSIAFQDWSHLDLVKDTVPGMSIDRAYDKLIKNKVGEKVIVGVIDSGVDIEHQALKNNLWVNTDEIEGNELDDDSNNYKDDIHGWNFLGDILHENLEFVRLMRKADKATEEYKKAEQKYQSKLAEAQENQKQIDFIVMVDDGIKEHLGKENYTLEDVKAIDSQDFKVMQFKSIMENILSDTTKEDFDKEVEGYKNYVSSQMDYHLNIEFDNRKKVGDNPNDITDITYGNADVIGPDKEEAKHGTHVSGIIVKSFGKNDHKNASQIEIMAIRAVPDGDEYDKDVALAIRYAADNGAKIINTSFGKEFSPQTQWVWDAILYAESKDVLIVNAAGNDAYDIDEVPVYPNDACYNKYEVADNFISVGALNFKYGKELLASFSNYGKENVDVFAPGVKIYAATPNDSYEFLSGTSMAAPSVSGVAALIRSYYPTLSASEVKQILMDSGIAIQSNVAIGGKESGIEKPFTETCKSGRIVNAYNALILAKKRACQKKKRK